MLAEFRIIHEPCHCMYALEHMELQRVASQTETWVWNLIWNQTRHQLRTNSFLNPLGGLL